MSKRFKCKTCVYCAQEGVAHTADHVVCKSFFGLQMRDNLPKVPACRTCNRIKADLEHYLVTLLPFGAQHGRAKATLEEMVPPRLARNRKLLYELSQGLERTVISVNGGPWQLQGSLPLDGQRLSKLFEFIVRGLAFHHWQLIFDNDYFVHADYLNEIGRTAFEGLLGKEVSHRIVADLGNGVFVYEGAQSGTHPGFTIWRMSLYGAEVNGGSDRRNERLKHAYGITVPKAWPVAGSLMAMFDVS